MLGAWLRFGSVVASLVCCVLSASGAEGEVPSLRQQQEMTAMREKNADGDLEVYRARQSGTYEALTIQDVLRLALKQNAELWLTRQEQEIQREIKTGALLKMLPNARLNLSWDGRDTYPAGESVGLFTERNAQLTKYSYGTPKETTEYSYGMLWNVMDFGVSYFRYRQEKRRQLMAFQETRRARQRIVLETTRAYYNALTLAQVAQRARALEKRIDAEIINTADYRELRLITASEAASRSYQLHQAKKRVSQAQEQAAAARTELTGWIGVMPDTPLSLRCDLPADPGAFALDLEALDRRAILSRPELFTEDQQEKISGDDAIIALLQALPTPSMFFRSENNDNVFLYYQNWFHWGMNMTVDLLSMPGQVVQAKAHRGKRDLVRYRRMALALAILTQVHLAAVEHKYALTQLRLDAKTCALGDEVLQNMRENLASGMNARESGILLQEVQQLGGYQEYMASYARILAARARLYSSVGADPEEWDGDLFRLHGEGGVETLPGAAPVPDAPGRVTPPAPASPSQPRIAPESVPQPVVPAKAVQSASRPESQPAAERAAAERAGAGKTVINVKRSPFASYSGATNQSNETTENAKPSVTMAALGASGNAASEQTVFSGNKELMRSWAEARAVSEQVRQSAPAQIARSASGECR